MLSMGMWFQRDHRKLSDQVRGQQIWVGRGEGGEAGANTRSRSRKTHLKLCEGEEVEESKEDNVDEERSAPGREQRHWHVFYSSGSLGRGWQKVQVGDRSRRWKQEVKV